MEENKINEWFLYGLAYPFQRVCTRFAFVGEVNKSWKNLTKIHMLCGVRDKPDLQEGREATNTDILKETDYRIEFNNIKTKIEGFTYDEELAQFHRSFPEITILVEEVSENEFPFAELKHNSSEHFSELALHFIVDFEDPIIYEDWSVERRDTGEKIIFKNERDLMEYTLGYYVPIHLRTGTLQQYYTLLQTK